MLCCRWCSFFAQGMAAIWFFLCLNPILSTSIGCSHILFACYRPSPFPPNASYSLSNIFISISFFSCWLLPKFKCFPAPSFFFSHSLYRQDHKMPQKKAKKRKWDADFVPRRFLFFWSDDLIRCGIICMYLNVSFIANYEYTVCFPCFSYLIHTAHFIPISHLFPSAPTSNSKYGYRNPNVFQIIK